MSLPATRTEIGVTADCQESVRTLVRLTKIVLVAAEPLKAGQTDSVWW